MYRDFITSCNTQGQNLKSTERHKASIITTNMTFVSKVIRSLNMLLTYQCMAISNYRSLIMLCFSDFALGVARSDEIPVKSLVC